MFETRIKLKNEWLHMCNRLCCKPLKWNVLRTPFPSIPETPSLRAWMEAGPFSWLLGKLLPALFELGAGRTLGSQSSVPICEKHDRSGNDLTAEIPLFKYETCPLFFFFFKGTTTTEKKTNKVCIYCIWTSSSPNSHLSSQGEMSSQLFSGLSILPPVLNLMRKWKHINLCDILA